MGPDQHNPCEFCQSNPKPVEARHCLLARFWTIIKGLLCTLSALSVPVTCSTMTSAITLPNKPSLETLEERLRERLKAVKRTSFGSEYVAFHASREEVVALAGSDLVNAFRRVILDPVRGLVMLMAPSGGHEITANDLDRFVSCVATLKGLRMEQLRATRWRREDDPRNTGLEADCSFYFGQKALECRQAYARSKEEADAYTFRVPPDLVVEVGVTHESKEKYLSYRDKGVAEFWQLNVRLRKQSRKIVTITFLDLQAEPKPLEIGESLNLPGLAPEHVIRFIRTYSKTALDDYERLEAVRALLNRSALEIREEAIPALHT